jgi:hypothetical protein
MRQPATEHRQPSARKLCVDCVHNIAISEKAHLRPANYKRDHHVRKVDSSPKRPRPHAFAATWARLRHNAPDLVNWCGAQASLAQWQSSGLLIHWLAVRARRGAPDFDLQTLLIGDLWYQEDNHLTTTLTTTRA